MMMDVYMMAYISDSVEEYLEAIYFFNEEGVSPKNTELAKRLKVAPPSVTQMVKNLADRGYVLYAPYKGVVLTGIGTALAQRIVRKHRLLERFLYDFLGMDLKTVHDEACRMEHSLSDEAAHALYIALNKPKDCPDDGRIIQQWFLDDSDINEHSFFSDGREAKLITELVHLKAGEKGIVSFVKEENILKKLGIARGDEVEVIKAEAFFGPQTLLIKGETLNIERIISSKIFVEVQEKDSDMVDIHPHGPHH
jgi:DtxR family Mn-dependent transcriptional regulator